MPFVLRAAFDLTRCAVETDYLRYATARRRAADSEKEHWVERVRVWKDAA